MRTRLSGIQLRQQMCIRDRAKDIRIFGLQNWLNELLDQIHNLYLDFTLRCERVEVLADITESVLTMARNGIAYVYLINMALNEGLSVSEFLLYFTAVTTFTTWVMGIMPVSYTHLIPVSSSGFHLMKAGGSSTRSRLSLIHIYHRT